MQTPITMKIKFTLLSLLASLFFYSAMASDKQKNPVGTYGVCESDPSRIELKLDANHTFHYRDLSNPKSGIQVSGTWVQRGNKVVLQSSNSGKGFHRVWRISEQGQTAKSRKGLCFYTLKRISNPNE